MNGGRLSRVTSVPLIAPASSPAATPISRARKPGTPLFAARFAMISEERMAMAPTDKSMPAVKMTKVCPIARAAITDTCCKMMPMVAGWMKRGLMIVKAITERTNTNNGLIEGWECRTC